MIFLDDCPSFVNVEYIILSLVYLDLANCAFEMGAKETLERLFMSRLSVESYDKYLNGQFNTSQWRKYTYGSGINSPIASSNWMFESSDWVGDGVGVCWMLRSIWYICQFDWRIFCSRSRISNGKAVTKVMSCCPIPLRLMTAAFVAVTSEDKASSFSSAVCAAC